MRFQRICRRTCFRGHFPAYRTTSHFIKLRFGILLAVSLLLFMSNMTIWQLNDPTLRSLDYVLPGQRPGDANHVIEASNSSNDKFAAAPSALSTSTLLVSSSLPSSSSSSMSTSAVASTLDLWHSNRNIPITHRLAGTPLSPSVTTTTTSQSSTTTTKTTTITTSQPRRNRTVSKSPDAVKSWPIIVDNSNSSPTSTSIYLAPSDIPVIDVTGASCPLLFDGNSMERQRAAAYQANHTKVPVKADELSRLAADCRSFVADRRYATRPADAEEADYPIAFSILMFKDVEQFERLLRAAYRPQNIYCVHVDAKSPDAIDIAVLAICRCFENVFVLDPAFNIQWGTFSVLEPELMCMKELLRRHRTWRYFINLTGQEWPLHSNWQIVRILKTFNGSNNIEGSVKRRNLSRFVGQLPAPYNLTIFKGSLHISVVRGFVEFVVNSREANEFLAWVKRTIIPDETLFATLNHNPKILKVPGAYLGEPETDTEHYRFLTRFKNWGANVFNWPCAGRFWNGVCILSVGDLPLLATRPELFANKFHIDYAPLALDCMEWLHYERLREQVRILRAGLSPDFNASVYEDQDFVWNHV